MPNSRENRECFGDSGNQVRALVSTVYDILNGFYLDIAIGHISNGETKLAKQNLTHITDGSDHEIILKHTAPRLNKIRRKYPEQYDYMSKKGETRTRLIRRALPTGAELALITNLPEEITEKQIGDLYYQRWEIEKKYHMLKNKLKLESVTGKASIYVYQDFRAQLLVYNMVQDIRRYADSEARKTGEEKGLAYPVRTNENIAIGLFKEQMIKIVMEESPKKQAKLLQVLQAEMEQHVLPIRDLPGNKRKKNISNKYKNNQKHSF